MLKVIEHKRNVPQIVPKKTPYRAAPSSKSEREKQLRTLHSSLANEWNLNGPEVRRVLLNRDETQTPKKKDVLVSIDEEKDELSKFEKGTTNMQKMNRYEQIHKLQSALQNRIMAHKYNEPPSVVYISQLKSIQQLMDFLKKQLAIDKNFDGKRKLEGIKERIRRYRQKVGEEPKPDLTVYPNCQQGWYFYGSS